MEACVTPYTESKSSDKVAGGKLKPFPGRLNAVPPRIAGGYIYIYMEAWSSHSRKTMNCGRSISKLTRESIKSLIQVDIAILWI